MFFGFTEPLGKFHDTNNKLGGALGLELRYNLRELPIDLGFQINITSAVHETPIHLENSEGNSSWGEYYYAEQSNRTLGLALIGDWNFRQGRRVNPFIGAGVGWASHDLLNDCVYYDGDGEAKPLFIPRVGVEFFRHLRITLASNISRKGYNNLQLTVGLVFGGGIKK
ncbi:MAG: hypothetical protein Q4F97_06725 [Bacteroidales bacterium]|nr:hypothetical protein [Bacteroidales bacterium]